MATLGGIDELPPNSSI